MVEYPKAMLKFMPLSVIFHAQVLRVMHFTSPFLEKN